MSPGPPQPAADDEVERRLAALKSGDDPAALGPVRDAVPEQEPAASPGDPAGAEAGRSGPGTSAAGHAGDVPPAIVGEVIEGAAPGPGDRRQADGAPPGPGVRAVSWSFSEAQAGRLGLWIGVGLVAFGAYLVLAAYVPQVATLGSLAIAILGALLVGWNLTGRAAAWALNGGAVLAGYGAVRLVADLAGLPPAGWGTLGAGLGLLAVAALRARRREGIGWQGWVGGALAIFGGWGVLGAVLPGFPTLGDLVVPLALVLVGIVVVRRGMRPRPPGA